MAERGSEPQRALAQARGSAAVFNYLAVDNQYRREFKRLFGWLREGPDGKPGLARQRPPLVRRPPRPTEPESGRSVDGAGAEAFEPALHERVQLAARILAISVRRAKE